MKYVLYIPGTILFLVLFSLLPLLSACGGKREALNFRNEASRRDAEQWLHHDSLTLRQDILRNEKQTLRWEEWVYARPDSTGQQYIERVVRGEAGSISREEASGVLERTATDSLARIQASTEKEQLNASRKTDNRPVKWLTPVLAGLLAGLVIGLFARRNK